MSPLFEYECAACGNTFEKLAYDLKDKPCPVCGSLAKRVISKPAYFKFKWGHPRFVDRIDDYQKKQVDEGKVPTLPQPNEVL